MTWNEAFDQLLPVIRRAARSVEFQWPNLLDQDDIEQEVSLRLMESPGSVEKILGMDDRARYRAIVGMGHQIANIERTDYDHFKGSYRYSVDEVKKLLGRGVLVEPLNGFNDAVIDLECSMEELAARAPQYVDVITKRYANDELPSNTTEQDALKNGLAALTKGMNKSIRTRFSERDDGVGTRAVLTRAQALDTSGSEWDGDDG